VVQIIRRAALPSASEVPEALRSVVAVAATIRLREARPIGFPLLLTAELELIEPAIAFLHEHAVLRAHSADTVRTYAEILYDWFETLEQNGIAWSEADAADLVAYRNRMLAAPSAHTHRPYGIRTINHRVRGVLRFYDWAVGSGWVRRSSLVGRGKDFQVTGGARSAPSAGADEVDSKLFVLRQFASLPRPLTIAQLRELLARLVPPYDLMARWQLYTGLRVSELLRLTLGDLVRTTAPAGTGADAYQMVEVLRKGRKNGAVIAPAGLLEETAGYMHGRCVRLQGDNPPAASNVCVPDACPARADRQARCRD